jgi:hypothetical protein
MATHAGTFTFAHRDAGCWIADSRVPEYLVAYEEGELVELAREIGFEVREIRHGSWSGREEALTFQDVVTFARGAVVPDG